MAAPTTVEEYLAGLPQSHRNALKKLRTTIRAAAPGATDTISYQIPTIKVDGRMDEIFALQDRLVRDLADLLRAVIRPTGAVTLETGVVGAYEAFSKGVVNLRAETYESLDRAVMLFEQAVDLDAGYARAHLELGVAYATKAEYLARGELRKQAVTSLRRALELQRLQAVEPDGAVRLHTPAVQVTRNMVPGRPRAGRPGAARRETQ